jgi:DNA-binding NarL/FixJ family response regulator
MPPLIKVALASDSSQLLGQARAALATEEAITIAGEARGAEQVLHLVRQRRPTLLLLDLALPPAGGHGLIAQVREQSAKTRVLAIDDQLDEGEVLRVAKTGARGYILKEAIPVYLAKAIRVMAAGEVWFSRKHMGKVVEELQRLVRLQGRPGVRRGRVSLRSS